MYSMCRLKNNVFLRVSARFYRSVLSRLFSDSRIQISVVLEEHSAGTGGPTLGLRMLTSCSRAASPKSRVCFLAIIATALWLIAQPTTSSAWDYREHFAITYRGLTDACIAKGYLASNPNSHVSQNRAGYDACSETARLCLAHMVALAGDYVSTPEALIKDGAKGLVLKRGGLDCGKYLTSGNAGDFIPGGNASHATVTASSDRPPPYKDEPQCLAPSGSVWTDEISFNLMANPLRRGWRWMTLATRNAKHFQPASRESWEEYSKVAQDSTQPRSTRIAYEAFAMHFLEDSFPAGHIGLDRSATSRMSANNAPSERYVIGRNQDYAHAYHDDLNHAGQALRSENKEDAQAPWWFGYGDKQLCAPTIYLYVPPAGAHEAPPVNDDLIQEVLKAVSVGPANNYQDKEFLAAAIEEINRASTKPREAPPVVLSLPPKGLRSAGQTSINDLRKMTGLAEIFKVLAVCSWSQYCDNTEIVLTNFSDRGISGRCDNGTAIAGAPSYLIVRCLESAEHVRRASVAAQSAFLDSLQDDANTASAEIALASSFIPSSYSPNSPSEATGHFAQLNIENKVLRYQPFKSTDDVEPRSFLAWGPVLTQVMSSPLRETTLSFGPTEQIEHIERCGVEGRFGLLTRHDDQVSAPLDSVAVSLVCHPLTPRLGRYYNIEARANLGYQGLWDGPERRNLFGGAGLGIELPFGRYVVDINLIRDIHWSPQLGRPLTTSLSFGVHVPSISLSKPAQ